MNAKVLFLLCILSTCLLSSCYLSGSLDDYAHEFSVIVDTDKLIAIGKLKSDNRFAVIGEKYVYIFEEKHSRQINDILSSNRGYYKIYDSLSDTENEINIRIYNEPDKKPKTCFRVDSHDPHKSMQLVCWVEIELYTKPQDMVIDDAYIFKKNIKINITAQNKGRQSVSNILLPFAVAADIVLSPVYLMIWEPKK